MRGFSGEMRKGMSGPAAAAGTDAGKKGGRRFVGGFGGAMKGIGGVMAGAFAVSGIASFVGNAISGASDVQQSFGALDSVFGDTSKRMKRFAADAATTVGLSKAEYGSLASVVGSQLINLGSSTEDAGKKTNELIGLGADLAATFGGPTSQAVEAVSSLFKGEFDPIERYGVSIKQADVNARLAAKGLDDLTGAEAKQAQQMATLELLYEQTGKAQGQFSRESDTLAGQQQRLGAQWDNLKATLGQALMPVATSFLGVLNDFIPAIKGVFSGGGNLGGTLGSLKSGFSGVFAALKPLLPIFRDIGSQLAGVLGPGLRKIGDVIVNKMIPAWADFLEATSPLREFVLKFLGKVLVKALKVVMTVFEGALNFISGALKVFTGLFTGDWDKTWEGVKQIGSAAWDTIRKLLGILFDKLGQKAAEGLSWLKGKFRAGWEKIKNVVKDKANDLIDWFKDLPGKIKSGLGDLGSLLFDAGKSVMQGLKDGMASMVDNVTQPVQDAASKVKSYWPFSPAKIGPLRKDPPETWGVNLMTGVAAGLRKGAGTLAPASSFAASAALPSAAMAPSRAQAAAPTIVLNANGDRHLLAWLREMVRTEGGDVQVVLGA